MVYGALVSSLITVKLLLCPLPCSATLIKGFSAPPNTFVLNKASPNIEGGSITPKSKRFGGCGILVLP